VKKSSDSRNPVGVNAGQRLRGLESLLGLKRSDEDTVGSEQVVDGGTFGEELGVGEDVKVDSRARVGVEDGSHRLGGSARDGRLLDDDLGGSSDSGDLTGGELDVAGRGEGREERGSEWES
jgi:hypothetical protein